MTRACPEQLIGLIPFSAARFQVVADQWGAIVRFVAENQDDPCTAYAIDKTDRILTEETMASLPESEVAEWHEACDEFELMSEEAQDAWVEKVLTEYPKIDELPDLDGYNHIN